ncbi:MAG: DinB family protein [Gemmatimonadetes bacterium]|nr:DinB family protein [Gemmatimonadota bacterium]
MSEIPREAVLRAVLPILSEAFAGPADPRSTHFVDNQADCGLFGTLDALTAGQASTPVQEGGSTAAAQAEHVRFSLDVSTRWMRGEREKADWASSWEVREVDDDAWTALRQQLHGAYDAFVVMVHQQPMDAELLDGLVATVAHAAYHLGALRQIARHAAARAETAPA